MCDTLDISKSFNGKSPEIFNYVCLDGSIKLGPKTKSSAFSLFYCSESSHLLPQLHQHISFFFFFFWSHSFLTPFFKNGHLKYFFSLRAFLSQHPDFHL